MDVEFGSDGGEFFVEGSVNCGFGGQSHVKFLEFALGVRFALGGSGL